ncbi:MAG: hypothetical protein M1814_000001 [Vezdaea aestivalis]|nr:MAG: hypothetical protein M1814_000001 [Vezdaea aestivalis]
MVVTLDGVVSYELWALTVTNELKKRKIWYVIDGSPKPRPRKGSKSTILIAEDMANEMVDREMERADDNVEALNCIYKTIAEPQLHLVKFLNEAQDVWRKLRDAHQPVNDWKFWQLMDHFEYALHTKDSIEEKAKSIISINN